MTTVYNNEGNEVGQYDGKFVYDPIGTKCYWIEDGEVFSMPPTHRENELSSRANIKVATLINGLAIDSDGVAVFALW